MKRIGIIGVGGIANGRHIPELLNVTDCKITAICDIDENAHSSTGDRLALDCGIGLRIIRSLLSVMM